MTRRSPPAQRRRARRWLLLGACFWLFLMTFFGTEAAGDERPVPKISPDEGSCRAAIEGQTGRGRGSTGL